MGVIQSSVNQMLATAGIVNRLDPEYETKQKLKKVESAQAKAETQLAVVKQTPTGKGFAPEKRQATQGALKDLSALAEERYQINPTPENYQSFLEAQKSVRTFETSEQRRINANERAKQTRLAKKIQKGDVKAIQKALREGVVNV